MEEAILANEYMHETSCPVWAESQNADILESAMEPEPMEPETIIVPSICDHVPFSVAGTISKITIGFPTFNLMPSAGAMKLLFGGVGVAVNVVDHDAYSSSQIIASKPSKG